MALRLSKIVSKAEEQTGKEIDDWSPDQLDAFHAQYKDYIGNGYGSGQHSVDKISIANHASYDYDNPIIKISYGKNAAPEVIAKKYSTYLFCKLVAHGANETDIKRLLDIDDKQMATYLRYHARTLYTYKSVDGMTFQAYKMTDLVDKVKAAGLHISCADYMQNILATFGGRYTYHKRLMGNVSSKTLVRRVVLYDSEGRALTDTKDIVKG